MDILKGANRCSVLIIFLYTCLYWTISQQIILLMIVIISKVVNDLAYFVKTHLYIFGLYYRYTTISCIVCHIGFFFFSFFLRSVHLYALLNVLALNDVALNV